MHKTILLSCLILSAVSTTIAGDFDFEGQLARRLGSCGNTGNYGGCNCGPTPCISSGYCSGSCVGSNNYCYKYNCGGICTNSRCSCNGVLWVNDEPENHFTADCSYREYAGADCIITASPGYQGGSVMCVFNEASILLPKYVATPAVATPAQSSSEKIKKNVS